VTSLDWAGESAKRWAAVADQLERQFEPVGDLLSASAWLRPGERVLDIGCGRGATTRRAAAETGPSGSVAGIDIAPSLIEQARAVPHVGAPIDWIIGDAQTFPLPRRAFDVVISRFGTLFFDDAVAAFRNVRNAAAPGARLHIVVWQHRERSLLLQRPLDVAAAAARSKGFDLELAPPDGGPFAFGDAAVARQVLGSAGWTGISVDPYVLDLYLGGPGTVDDIVETGLTLGPVQTALASVPADLIDDVRAALIADLAPLHDGTGVKLPGAVAVVTATR
jgi:SAM-dependent methyltransferase